MSVQSEKMLWTLVCMGAAALACWPPLAGSQAFFAGLAGTIFGKTWLESPDHKQLRRKLTSAPPPPPPEPELDQVDEDRVPTIRERKRPPRIPPVGCVFLLMLCSAACAGSPEVVDAHQVAQNARAQLAAIRAAGDAAFVTVSYACSAAPAHTPATAKLCGMLIPGRNAFERALETGRASADLYEAGIATRKALQDAVDAAAAFVQLWGDGEEVVQREAGQGPTRGGDGSGDPAAPGAAARADSSGPGAEAPPGPAAGDVAAGAPAAPPGAVAP